MTCCQGAANYRASRAQEVKIAFLWRSCRWLIPRQWFDIAGRGEDNNVLECQGFMFALRDTLRLSPGALLFAGVPCSRFLDFSVYSYIIDSRNQLEHIVWTSSCWCCGGGDVVVLWSHLSWVWISSNTHQRYSSILGDDRSWAKRLDRLWIWTSTLYSYSANTPEHQ